MKYSICMLKGFPTVEYKTTVDGESVVIPGFESVEIFIHKTNINENEAYWGITEKYTGLALVHTDLRITSKESAIELVTQRLKRKGVLYVLNQIKKKPAVESLPELPDEEEPEELGGC